ncbi:MAG: MobF family relaxase [Acidimicrobiales bacterium]
MAREAATQPVRDWRMAHWGGAGAAALGLSGAVTDEGLEQFVALGEAGLGPSGEQLVRRINGSVQADTITFSPPKSVSLLWAGLVDQAQRDLVLDAQLAAVDAAMAVFEREAMRVRRGHKGRDGELRAGGVWGSFLHLSSRENDPQIHSHVVFLNAALGEDGRWNAWTRRSRGVMRLAEAVYRLELERHLDAVFGVEWTLADEHGNREIAGFDDAVLRGHSKRRQQIERKMTEGGTYGREAAQLAAYQTRRRKDPEGEHARTHDELAASLAQLGWPPGRIEREVLGRAGVEKTAPDAAEIAPAVLARLSAARAVFTRDDVAAALGGIDGGASAAQIDALIDAVLSLPGVVEVAVVTADGTPLAPGSGTEGLHAVPLTQADPGGTFQRRWTTQKILDQEAEVDRWVVIGRESGAAMCKERDVERAIARRTLDPAAAEMVRHLTLRGDRIAFAEGPPGTGKTFAVGAAARAWEVSGYRVRGTATSAKAASELADGAGIETENTTALLNMWDQWGQDLPDRHTVLIIDETSTASTHHLHTLVGWVRQAGGKVVLIGDSRQHAAVERGGMFARLCSAHEHPVLAANVRQADPADVTAIEDLRAGRAALAAGSFARRGRLVTVKDLDEVPRMLAAEYLERAARGEQVLLGAATRDEVAGLNALVRAARVAAGELGEPVMTVGVSDDRELSERELAVGDRVIALRNKRSLGIENADRGVVVGVCPARRNRIARLAVRLERGGIVTLPEDYVRDHLDHGYASTLHKLQGATVGKARVARKGAAEVSEHGWVGISGGRARPS